MFEEGAIHSLEVRMENPYVSMVFEKLSLPKAMQHNGLLASSSQNSSGDNKVLPYSFEFREDSNTKKQMFIDCWIPSRLNQQKQWLCRLQCWDSCLKFKVVRVILKNWLAGL